ncbi:MAG: translation elongation factor EF-1 subunit alpha [Candidatus Micrarchaeaceae archaeon]
MAEKPHMNIIFIGHIDHGKSTTVGRLLYDTGAISDQDLKKMKELTQQYNQPTLEFAFIMDQLKEERERGITIDIMHRDFQTSKYYFTIIDAPGHRDFVKNMITGASQADAAFLVISAPDGIQDQTREHAFLCKVLGINQLIVGVNKMDMVNFDEAKFEDIKSKASALLKSIGYDPTKINFIPYSAQLGENVSKKSDKMSWYKGPTILDALDMLSVPQKPIDKPLRIPIQDVNTVSGIGTVPVGVVESGVLKPGDTVIIAPKNIKGEVKSIEMHHKPLNQAVPGDNIGFNLRGVEKKDISRGDVVGDLAHPPTVVQEFTALVTVINHPTAIAAGYTPVFHIHTANVASTFAELIEKVDPRTRETLEKNPKFIKNGDVAVVKIRPSRPVVVEKFSDFPPLGRFAIRDMGRTIAAGIVQEVTPLNK